MSEQQPDINQHIAQHIRELRLAKGYSLDQLAARSGVSRSSISLIERAATSPTAVILEKLAAALDVSLASLFVFDATTSEPQPLLRYEQQKQWCDPASGYLRRNLSPVSVASPMQLAEITFPAHKQVSYDFVPREVKVYQQIWLLEGEMQIHCGEQSYTLQQGDCLSIQLNQPIVFQNFTVNEARYLVAVCEV
ncbi:XRE family transcriptional regulator [Acinetobacter sp. ANC 4633]|uniref:helix-turn-helix domain-containing protein n=1 Tax=Acinetobacter sp. ANC 4633 TaxID=2529845 RepID=UPI00103EA726|nr:XRE family transcriptional regulator [Acinetobacter sp. ANC 4633]TCB27656.1 XRE family transcriptional regulator [Acinetobacter sp. ANC 4633]